MKKAFLIIIGAFLLYSCTNKENGKIMESGTLEANDIVVGSKVGGEVIELLKDDGEEVKKGETLLVIDTLTYGIKLRQAKANLKMAEAKYELLLNGARDEDKKVASEAYKQAKTNFRKVERDYNRYKNLLESKTITKKQFDEIETAYQIAKSKLNQAEQNLIKTQNISRKEEIKQVKASKDVAAAMLEEAKKAYDDCFVKSPITGTIIKTLTDKGELVAPTGAVFKIADLSMMEMYIYVNEVKLPRVDYGQKAKVMIDGFPAKEFDGKVVYISDESEFTPKNVQTKDERTKLVYAVKLEIPNKENYLKSGMPADAEIIVE